MNASTTETTQNSREKTKLVRRGLWKISRAARFIDCSRGHVYDLIDAGKLPDVRIGSMRRVPVSAIKRLVEESIRQPAETILVGA